MPVVPPGLGFEHEADGPCCPSPFASTKTGEPGMMACMRALVIAKDSPAIQRIKQLLEQSSFDCLQVEDWIEAIRWSTDESLDLIVSELNAADWKDDRVFELVERGAFGAIPPPMVVLASDVGHFAPTERFSRIAKIAPLPPSFGKSDLACVLERLFPKNDPRGQ